MPATGAASKRRRRQAVAAPMVPPCYYATITYRPDDEPPGARPDGRYPQLGSGQLASEQDAEKWIARTCDELTHQPTPPHYVILRIDREQACGRCGGSKRLRVKPRGWRKVPWWMCKEVDCPQCHGTGEQPSENASDSDGNGNTEGTTL